MRLDGRRRKLVWRLVLFAGFIVEIVMIVVGSVSIAREGYEFSIWETIAFVAIAIWIYIAYLKQRNLDISRFVVDEKIKTHALVENLKEGILLVDGENRLLVINSRAAKLAGISDVDWLGKDLTVQADEAVRKILVLRQEGEVECCLVPGGSCVRLQVVKLASAGGEDCYRLVYVNPVEQKSDSALPLSGENNNQRAIGVMAGLVDELLGDGTGVLAGKGWTVRRGRLLVQAIAEGVQQKAGPLKGLIRQKGLAGTLTKVAMPVGRLWRDLPAQLLAVARANGVELDMPEESADALPINGNPAVLAMAMEQIVCNAVLESIPKGRVVVRVGNMGAHVGLAVMDSAEAVVGGSLGCVYDEDYAGVPAKDTADGLVRVDGTGYFLARGIVEAHGGTLTVDAQPTGGLRVMMMLPGS